VQNIDDFGSSSCTGPTRAAAVAGKTPADDIGKKTYFGILQPEEIWRSAGRISQRRA
jgi:hypothetical protein